MLTDKAYAICILKILAEYSDEDHILQMKDILSKLKAKYDLSPDRRTVYSAVGLLNELGYDISIYEENGKGYYLRERLFEPSEIKLLLNSVYALPFITAAQTEELIVKLQSHLSMHQRKHYRNLTIAKEEKKTDNKQVFLNIDLLDEAITRKLQVKFYYYDYGIDKALHKRREERYIMCPYAMVFTNGHFYLLCGKKDYNEPVAFRIDRMKEVEITDVPIEGISPEKSNLENAAYAFLGKPETIMMKCDKGIINDILDFFGNDVYIADSTDGDILVSFSAPPRGILYWALQYLPYVEVLEPKWLREQVIESLNANRYNI